jgi:hypothetical protein
VARERCAQFLNAKNGAEVTNEQIIALRESVRAERKLINGDGTPSVKAYVQSCKLDHIEHSCRVALAEKKASRGDSRSMARVRCATIINARRTP